MHGTKVVARSFGEVAGVGHNTHHTYASSFVVYVQNTCPTCTLLKLKLVRDAQVVASQVHAKTRAHHKQCSRCLRYVHSNCMSGTCSSCKRCLLNNVGSY